MSHTNDNKELSHRKQILKELKQDRTLLEQAEILDLLERIKEEGKLSGDSYLVIKVSEPFKELYLKYYAPKKPTLSPQTENLRRVILYTILDYLYDTIFSKQDPEIQEEFFKICEELGYPIRKIRKIIEEEGPSIVVVEQIVKKAEEKKAK